MKKLRSVLRHAKAAAVYPLVSTLLLSGCVTQQAPPYQVGLANQIALNRLPPTARAKVNAATSGALGTHASVRVVKIAAPGEQSWSDYLVDAVRAELTTSGNFDAMADTTIVPTLTSAEIRDGKADASARITVQQAGQVVYDKSWTCTDPGMCSSSGCWQSKTVLRKHRPFFRH
ncbi:MULTISPECIES: hypothetical protein [unclassified Achromobacter]|uniref:hypothetical protein n=1 Tax=unclassified Achromobacter TaxID=2626865 RepID=UPI0011784443|nr:MULTISPECIES: hypothetical protein [unclassified Achromobacter]